MEPDFKSDIRPARREDRVRESIDDMKGFVKFATAVLSVELAVLVFFAREIAQSIAT